MKKSNIAKDIKNPMFDVPMKGLFNVWHIDYEAGEEMVILDQNMHLVSVKSFRYQYFIANNRATNNHIVYNIMKVDNIYHVAIHGDIYEIELNEYWQKIENALKQVPEVSGEASANS